MEVFVCDGSRALGMMAKYVVFDMVGHKAFTERWNLSPFNFHHYDVEYLFVVSFFSPSCFLQHLNGWGETDLFLHVTLDACIVLEPECYGWRIQYSLNPSNPQEVVIFLTTACFPSSETVGLWLCCGEIHLWRNISLYSPVFFHDVLCIFPIPQQKAVQHLGSQENPPRSRLIHYCSNFSIKGILGIEKAFLGKHLKHLKILK